MKLPKCNPLVIQMPKEHNYRIEEGRYTGLIHKIVRTPRSNCQNGGDVLRIICALQVAGKENFLNLAKAELSLNLEHGSDLRRVLSRLLGKEQMSALSGGELDLESLVGRPVDVEIEHIRTNKTDQYDYPFVNVSDLRPAGTLIEAVTSINPKPKEMAN